MSSEDSSDDEPLSVLATQKKAESGIEILPVYSSTDGLAEKIDVRKKCDVSITIQSVLQDPPMVERPADVWLYLTDFNPTGPYTCLLCSEWFLNRNRIVVHYVIDHKKEYCGICRYLLENREAMNEHQKFHMPWKCSQCGDICENQTELALHYSQLHNLVHCRFCSLRCPDGEEYQNHLLQKHAVTQPDCTKNESLWDFEDEKSQKFLCLLCSRKLNKGKEFSHHYMSYHHFTLKCFTNIISGVDLGFNVRGIDLTPEFIEAELKSYSCYGYVDFVKNMKVKEEPVAEETVVVNCEPDLSETYDDYDNDNTKPNNDVVPYKGVQDFDIALVEVIVLQKCYFQYVHGILKEISMNTMPVSSEVNYSEIETLTRPVNCCFCTEVSTKKSAFETHVSKAHSMKIVPVYWCRVCAATFDSLTELETHCSQELGEFDDLWICQFCDKEFDGREATRKHLTEHWDLMEYDNCFSPHLGFKCKFCPILFWNEDDRESHHVKVHYDKNPSDFYSCTLCDKVFGDKIFFTHHQLEEHDVETPYLLKCCVCSIVLDNVDEMRGHFEIDHPRARKTYCCLDDCQYRPFLLKKSLHMHLKTFHTAKARATRPTTCPTCGTQFSSVKACLQHAAAAHGPPRLACAHCHMTLHTTDERRIHYLLRHPNNALFQCEQCDKSFQHKSSLYVHKQLHRAPSQDYTCDLCRKSFVKRDSFREHMMIHEAPRHACSFCPMRFVQRSNMLRHERRHTGERPYSCQYCPRTFADKGACNSHERTHQNTSFACVYCGQTFAQKSKLTYHIRRHTGENLETCSLCSKMFTSAGSLRDHMRTHQKQNCRKTVKCPLCKKLYMDTRDMLKHMRGAHTAGQFQCPLCGKCVGSGSSLREHVMTHSERKAYQCKFCPKAYHGRKSIIYHMEKWHGAKPPITPDLYRHLSPRECKLKLADDLIDKIFYPKKTNTDLIIGDFVTFNKDLVIKTAKTDEDENEDNQSEEGNEEKVTIKMEPEDETDEIPPSDFVNVKIEIEEENQDEDVEMD